jgi:hypothetical protein
MRARSVHISQILAIDYTSTFTKRLAFLSFTSLSLIFAFTVFHAQADEANPFAKNYKEQNTYKLKSLNPNPDTKLLLSNHKEDDNIKMLEDGYDMIGSSGFTAVEAAPDLALQQGKAIKADTVLIYKKYDSAKITGSKLQLVKEAAKKGTEIDPNDLIEEPTKHTFYASYWAKLPMPTFGVHVIKLKLNTNDSPVEGTEKIEELPGLNIIAVIKDSAAAKANIVRGDTLLKMGDVTLTKADDLFAAVKKYAGKSVTVELERKGLPTQVTVALNPRK